MERTIEYEGVIELNNVEIECYVLKDGSRVLSSREMQRVLKMVDEVEEGKQAAGTRLSRYLNQKSLKPFIYKGKEQDHFEPIICYKGKSKINGYKADVLIDICDAFLQARKKIELSPRQEIIAEQCEILVRSFAKVGLIALIDEATGYQDVRVKNALQKILDQYLLEEAKKYKVTFPLDLYKEWFRLNNWEWKPESAQKKPSVIGRWTNKYIYERMAPGLLTELERKNPKNEKGYRKHKHFQFLTEEIGEPRLREFFGGLIALARASTTWRKYIRLVERAYPGKGQQLEFLIDDVED